MRAIRSQSADPLDPKEASVSAHPEALARIHAVAGRCMDGAKLYFFLKADASHRASAGIAVLVGEDPADDDLGVRFLAWFDAAQPAAPARRKSAAASRRQAKARSAEPGNRSRRP